MNSKSFAPESARMLGSARLSFMILSCHDSVIIAINCTGAKGGHNGQGGFKNLQNRSRPRQSAHFSSIIGVLAPTAVGGYDFLKPPWAVEKNIAFHFGPCAPHVSFPV